MNENASYDGDGRVGFCFGVARGRALPGPALVRMLADLGVTTSAARSRLARLVERGSLTTTRRGRTVEYRMAGPFAEAFARSDRFAAPSSTWDGELRCLVVTVAEERRAFRDAFRRQAVLAGYGQLRPGLFIAPEDRSAPLADLIAQAPDPTTVLSARLRLTADDSRIAAAQAWGLEAIADRYRVITASIEAALAEHHDPQPSGATLRVYAEVVEGAFAQFATDPALPTALLPHDWPHAALAVSVESAIAMFGPACGRYVDGLLAAGITP